MSRVRIVGGGLTGILAALQAHRLGARRIELYERLDQLGGVALPEVREGREMREGCIYFGPSGDPIRCLLEDHGVHFEGFDNRFGSVSKNGKEIIYTEDFGGPAIPASSIALSPLGGSSLADRIACYDDTIAIPLARYVRWHLGCNPSLLHGSAAVPLAINRVFPSKANLGSLSDAKSKTALANDLFGIPRSLWNYSTNVQASLPVGGFTALSRQCRVALESIGVEVKDCSLATPKAMFAEHSPTDVLVWAASPMPLFKAVGLEAPKEPTKRFATYTFEVQWTGPTPFYVQSFTAQGSCFRAYIYESAGSMLLTAECVVEDPGRGVLGDIHRMLEGFQGELQIGERLYASVKPRWLYHSVSTIERLAELRAALVARIGPNIVPGAWEPYAKSEKFAEVGSALAAVFGGRIASAA